MQSFFDKNYKIPAWLKNKSWFINKDNNKTSRRHFLKSAAGAVAIASTPVSLLAKPSTNNDKWQITPLWQTLTAVLDHLLPASPTGPSAQDILATNYLHNVIILQPTSKDEITFIKNGVGWLNDYSKSQLAKPFIKLTTSEKETILRGISHSQAGNNWISTLIGYIYEAMLTPPIYGGNPSHIGEKWLNHQPGFPLPNIGTRYYELPGNYRIEVNTRIPNQRRTKS